MIKKPRVGMYVYANGTYAVQLTRKAIFGNKWWGECLANAQSGYNMGSWIHPDDMTPMPRSDLKNYGVHTR